MFNIMRLEKYTYCYQVFIKHIDKHNIVFVSTGEFFIFFFKVYNMYMFMQEKCRYTDSILLIVYL